MLTPAKFAKFDPARPLPRTTVANMMATGVGQADPMRLWIVTILGAVMFLGILGLAPGRWLAAMPMLVLVAFGIHGLAGQKLYDMDLEATRADRLRRTLTTMRTACAVTGAVAAGVWVAGLVVAGLVTRA